MQCLHLQIKISIKLLCRIDKPSSIHLSVHPSIHLSNQSTIYSILSIYLGGKMLCLPSVIMHAVCILQILLYLSECRFVCQCISKLIICINNLIESVFVSVSVSVPISIYISVICLWLVINDCIWKSHKILNNYKCISGPLSYRQICLYNCNLPGFWGCKFGKYLINCL